MIEYRQYVPDDAPDALDSDVEDAVRCALSRQASADDDPDEFYRDVTIDRRDSRRGGHWVHGSLDRGLVADYLHEPVERERYEVEGAVAMIEGNSDLSPDELSAHLAQKGERA